MNHMKRVPVSDTNHWCDYPKPWYADPTISTNCCRQPATSYVEDGGGYPHFRCDKHRGKLDPIRRRPAFEEIMRPY